MSEQDSPIIDANTSYEEAKEELAGVVRTLETGGLNLDQTIELWERGEALAHYCREKLDGAATRIEEVLAAHNTDDSDDDPDEVDDDIDESDDDIDDTDDDIDDTDDDPDEVDL